MNKKLVTRMTGMAGAGLLIAQSLLPAFAAINISVSGNGYGSNNDADFNYSTQTTVSQSNNVSVNNKIDQDANTGDNTVSKNTGADIDVQTGDVTQTAEVTTVAGANSAVVEACGCDLDLVVAIEKNGADTKNDVDFDLQSGKQLFQTNYVDVKNDVDQDGNTGDNEIDKNTGGDIALTTGDVDQAISLTTEAGLNVASLGSSDGGVDLELVIAENGADSRNDLDVTLELYTVAAQNNSVDVYNDVDQDALTGKNDVDANTGGDIDVETGGVDQAIEVWNGVGFNALEVDECCELEGEIVVDKNGVDTKNDVDLDIEFGSEYFQACGGEQVTGLAKLLNRFRGGCDLDNNLDQDAETGKNDVEKNTGDDLTTGDVDQLMTVENEAGANVIGEGAGSHMTGENVSFLTILVEMVLG